MSGSFPALPNLERDWFLVSVPVLFEGAERYALVLLKSEENGVVQRSAELEHYPGDASFSLDPKNVFLREDEILATDGAVAVRHLSAVARGLQAAIYAGRCRREIAKSRNLAGVAHVVAELLDRAVQASVYGRGDSEPLLSLQRLCTSLSVSATAPPTDPSARAQSVQ